MASDNPPKRRANDLTGREWLRYSVSVWRDLPKTAGERSFRHPAMFPSALVERLMACFTGSDDRTVLDPFMGSGSTLVAARRAGKTGIGFEVNPDYIALARRRLGEQDLFTADAPEPVIHEMDARRMSTVIPAGTVALCVTSPPYWNILSQKRTADSKPIRDYGDNRGDLSQIADYEAFLDALKAVFTAVYETLEAGRYCIVNVMDLRKGPRFFPLHSDLASRMIEIGFIFDDLIIWDRGSEYNNLRCLGYPYVFRINKVHEFLLIFQKPRSAG